MAKFTLSTSKEFYSRLWGTDVETVPLTPDTRVFAVLRRTENLPSDDPKMESLEKTGSLQELVDFCTDNSYSAVIHSPFYKKFLGFIAMNQVTVYPGSYPLAGYGLLVVEGELCHPVTFTLEPLASD